MEHFLNAQHCLTIAAGFIAIIAACATLITSANNKAESLATRIRELTKEHRERRQDRGRCEQLEKQLKRFKNRFIRVQLAQGSLFLTIGIFIASLAIFLSLGLNIVYEHISEDDLYTVAHTPLRSIMVLGRIGIILMGIAIILQLWEVVASYFTLNIESSDCLPEESTQAAVQASSAASGD